MIRKCVQLTGKPLIDFIGHNNDPSSCKKRKSAHLKAAMYVGAAGIEPAILRV